MMHDDVIDGADVRRGQTTAHRHFGNKKAILGGDFLLSRGSGAVTLCFSLLAFSFFALTPPQRIRFRFSESAEGMCSNLRKR